MKSFAVKLPRWGRVFLGAWVLVVLVPAPGRSEDDLWGGRRTFAAKLSADNQTTLTNSDGKGTVSMVFDIATKTATWEITFENLTSPPVAIQLHGPAQPGTNAAPLIDLAGGKLRSPIRGASQLTAAHVQYLLLGWTYVSLATKRYPDGEIRGKVDVVPPPELVHSKPQPR